MKILINTPRLIPHGGVSNHYLGLQKYWTETIKYNPIGKVNSKQGSGIFRLPINIIVFIKHIIQFKPDIILLNPSLSKSAIKRDMIFLQIAKLFNKKVVVFFHGFDKTTIKKINIPALTRKLNQCECILILAEEFKKIVTSWGVKAPIHLTTTKVDNELITNFDIQKRTGNINTILFLARITKEKGIFIALNTFKIIQRKYPNIQLHVVGGGPELEEAKRLCKKENIPNVLFLGTLSGQNLTNEFINTDLYLFPTNHAEGMPTSVLEAMAFGLPIISRPVGGLCDFFKNGEMGELINSLDAKDFANVIDDYLKDSNLVKNTSYNNHEYAIKHFLASIVAPNIETILKQYI